MIVSNLEQAKAYLPSVNTLVANDRLTDFFRRAQEWVTAKIIGIDIEDILEIELEGTDPHERLRMLVSRVICEMAYLDAMSELDLQLSEAGFVVQSNQMVSPASQQRMDRLKVSLQERMATDCDGLVRYLVKHSGTSVGSVAAPYDDWRGTEQYAWLTQALMPTMGVAVQSGLRGDHAPKAWPDYHDLQPELATAMHRVAAPYVSDEEIVRLVELERDGEALAVHTHAMGQLRRTAALEVAGEHAGAMQAAMAARRVMVMNEDYFPAFAASDRRTLDTVNFGNGPSMNCL